MDAARLNRLCGNESWGTSATKKGGLGTGLEKYKLANQEEKHLR